MKIKIKLTRHRVEALYMGYQRIMAEAAGNLCDDHEQLLLELAITMRHRLADMLKSDREKYTIVLTSVEALAFVQLWAAVPTERGSLICVTVASFIEQIDKMSSESALKNAF
ncbi:MAG: hypothetical protein JST88_09210 [Bacteroidetes bacterium]|nr:hypothetical protein [Bacteroidota bacterium]